MLYGAGIYGGGLDENATWLEVLAINISWHGSDIERDTQVDDQLGNIAGREKIARF